MITMIIGFVIGAVVMAGVTFVICAAWLSRELRKGWR
jgi:uncharacterized membrane protein YccC